MARAIVEALAERLLRRERANARLFARLQRRAPLSPVEWN
jgi:hypothetical protein